MKKIIGGVLFSALVTLGFGCAQKSALVVAPIVPPAPAPVVASPAVAPTASLDGHYAYTDDTTGPLANQHIDVQTLPDGRLKIQGEAFWQGANPENIHNGIFAGVVNAASSRAVYASGKPYVQGDEDNKDYEGCVVVMDFSGDTIHVKDNAQCGGANVSFTGTYQKKNGAGSDWTHFEESTHAYEN